jgi:hypothetical protein
MIKELLSNKVIKISFIITLISLVLTWLVGKFAFIGALINKFYSCDDTVLNSFLNHCYTKYDLNITLFLAIIFILSFLVTLIAVIYFLVKRGRKLKVSNQSGN